jgi:hypothetical protein
LLAVVFAGVLACVFVEALVVVFLAAVLGAVFDEALTGFLAPFFEADLTELLALVGAAFFTGVLLAEVLEAEALVAVDLDLAAALGAGFFVPPFAAAFFTGAFFAVLVAVLRAALIGAVASLRGAGRRRTLDA